MLPNLHEGLGVDRRGSDHYGKAQKHHEAGYLGMFQWQDAQGVAEPSASISYRELMRTLTATLVMEEYSTVECISSSQESFAVE